MTRPNTAVSTRAARRWAAAASPYGPAPITTTCTSVGFIDSLLNEKARLTRTSIGWSSPFLELRKRYGPPRRAPTLSTLAPCAAPQGKGIDADRSQPPFGVGASTSG